jgi:hypothetical protein
MSNNADYYRQLAARAQTEADEATLDNVRDRALRSAAAFETMALQHEHTAKRRAERENAAASDAESALISASVAETHKEET